jgi:hypothetical protein
MPVALITVSHLANVLILLPVVGGLLRGVPQMEWVFGPDTTSRQILMCLYSTILIGSLGALWFGNQSWTVPFAWGLFGAQIVYKVLTLVAIKDRRVPVYWFNLGVAALHVVTLSQNRL